MFNGWMDGLLVGLQTINSILTAGIAITAFSLFLYALSFNLRDRVARSFAIILLCVVVVFTTEALQNKSFQIGELNCFCVCSGLALSFYLPLIYIFLMPYSLRPVAPRGDDAGSPCASFTWSHWGSCCCWPQGMLVGVLVPNGAPAPHLRRTAWTEVFTVYYIGIMVWAGYNFMRAFSQHVDAFGPAQDVVSDGGRDSTSPRFLSVPFVWFQALPRNIHFSFGARRSLLTVGCSFGDCDGLCGRVLWRFLA